MPFKKGENPNHPPPGSSTEVEPIRQKSAIKRIKKLLQDNPRDYCIFITGINTAYRAKEILSIKVCQVRNLAPGDTINIKTKTKKYRRVALNSAVIEAVGKLLATKEFNDYDYLFQSQRGENRPIKVDTLSYYVKCWLAAPIFCWCVKPHPTENLGILAANCKQYLDPNSDESLRPRNPAANVELFGYPGTRN